MKKWWKKFNRLTKTQLRYLLLAAVIAVAATWTCLFVQAFETSKKDRVIVEQEAKIKRLRSEWVAVTSAYHDACFEIRQIRKETDELRGAPTTHTVVRGECLWKISAKRLGDAHRWPEIWDLNRGVIGDNPHLIYPGQVFNLPISR